jgi:hypothetical protein
LQKDAYRIEEAFTLTTGPYSKNPQEECLRNFSERMKNLAPFACVVKKLGNLQKYAHYDMFSIGFGVMLFVLENMLSGREECSIEEIADFLQNIIYKNYCEHILQDEAKELAFYIRDSIAGSGEPFYYSYMNLEKGIEEKIPVKLMDVSFYEIKGHSRYKLTDQGMELLFKTREIYSEFRLNVTQLYLRQQIEKGIFEGARQTVNELSLQVRQLKERIDGIMEGIRQNVLGVDFEELKKLLKRIEEHFNQERKEFENIRYILMAQRKTIEELDLHSMTPKDIKNNNDINDVAERVKHVAQEHTSLFNEKLDIISEYIHMLEYRMKIGITEFMDFEAFLLDRLATKNICLQGPVRILSPLFVNKKKNKVFNIMKAFEHQRMKNVDDENEETVDYEKEIEDKQAEHYRVFDERNEKVKNYVINIMSKILEEKETTIGKIITELPRESYEKVSMDFDFLSLMTMLHQRKTINISDVLDMKDRLICERDKAFNINPEYLIVRALEENEHLKSLQGIEIIASDKEFTFENGNTVTDYLITGVAR